MTTTYVSQNQISSEIIVTFRKMKLLSNTNSMFRIINYNDNSQAINNIALNIHNRSNKPLTSIITLKSQSIIQCNAADTGTS